MPAIVLIGAQWGDEGKGKATDLLGGRVQWVVRYQGGNNAGHTVVLALAALVAPFAAPSLALPAPFPPVLKYAAQLGSTLPGSRWNCSYISSTSHSLAPKSEEGADEAESDGLVCCCDTGLFRLFRDVRVVDGVPLPG